MNNKVLLFLVIILVPIFNTVMGQRTEVWNNKHRSDYLKDLDKKLQLDIDSVVDSTVVVHFKNSVYTIVKRGDSIKIKETLFVKKIVHEKEKLLSNQVLVYEGLLTSYKDTAKWFKTLFDPSTAVWGSWIGKQQYTSSPGLTFHTAYVQSFTREKYLYSEIPLGLLDDIFLGSGKNLLSLLEGLLEYSDHWAMLEKFIKSKGFGRYRYGDRRTLYLDFDYLKNGKFKVYHNSKYDVINSLPRI